MTVHPASHRWPSVSLRRARIVDSARPVRIALEGPGDGVECAFVVGVEVQPCEEGAAVGVAELFGGVWEMTDQEQ